MTENDLSRRGFLGSAATASVRPPNGAFEPTWAAADIVREFLAEIQSATAPTENTEGWVQLGEGRPWEHTSWLDRDGLVRLFGPADQESYMPDDPDVDPAERVKRILTRKREFVARVDADRRFLSLVDRAALLEQVATRTASEL